MQGGELWVVLVVVVYCCNISKNVYTAELLVLKGKNMQLLSRQVSKNSFSSPVNLYGVVEGITLFSIGLQVASCSQSIRSNNNFVRNNYQMMKDIQIKSVIEVTLEFLWPPSPSYID